MTRLLAAAVLLGLVVAGSALAARGDPQRQINAADQARAKAMVLTKADVGARFKASAPSSDSGGYCKALDESDLTLRGKVDGRVLSSRVVTVASDSRVYESVADATTSFRRLASAAGLRCVKQDVVKDLGRAFVSLEPVPFPRLAARTYAVRLIARSRSGMFYSDIVQILHARARASAVFASVARPVPRAEQVRLARLIAGRMTQAMRGA